MADMAGRVVLTYRDYDARHGVPFHWIEDLDHRRLEVYVLTGDAFRLASALEDDASGSLPPFPELTIAIASLWTIGGAG